MKDLITRVFNEKLEDGTIEKIVGKHIEDMVSDILKDQMGWNGEVKKALAERVKPIALAAVDKCDLSKTAAVVAELLNNALRETPVHLLKETFDGIKGLYSQNDMLQKIRFGQTVKLSDIFKEYCALVENKGYDEDELQKKGIECLDDYEGEGKSAFISAELIVEETTKETYYGFSRRKYTVEMRISLNGEEEGLTFCVSEAYDKSFRIEIETGGLLLAELSSLDPFIMYLIALKNNFCKIEIDTESEQKDLEVKVE